MTQATIQQSSTKEASSTGDQVTSLVISQEQIDVLNKLLKPEIQEALPILVKNLPKLTEMVTFLIKSYDVAQSVMTDRVLFNDLTGGIQELIKPVEEKVKEYTATAIEANDRAQANEAVTIGLFSLWRMLKDPQVQKLFRFVQAYLDIMSERQKRQ